MHWIGTVSQKPGVFDSAPYRVALVEVSVDSLVRCILVRQQIGGVSENIEYFLDSWSRGRIFLRWRRFRRTLLGCRVLC